MSMGADSQGAATLPDEFQTEKAAAPALEAPLVNYTVGYSATGSDGITASPKVRQMLDERSKSQVSPAKQD